MDYGIQPYQMEPKRRRIVVDDNDDEGENLPIEIPENNEWRKHSRPGEWCQCERCEAMDTADECLCCREIANVTRKMNIGEENEIKCITEHFEFEIICLHPAVLRTALIGRSDIRCDDLRDPIPNETFRLQGYRQFTYWVHDRLGKAVRRVIPACVVKTIRREFPNEEGIYVGFKEAERQ